MADPTIPLPPVPPAAPGIGRKILGKSLGPITTTGIGAYELSKVDSNDPAAWTKRGEITTDLAISGGAGWAGAGLASAGFAAAGLTTGIVASGGTAAVGIVVAVAASYAIKKVDQSLYGESDALFHPKQNLQHMTALSQNYLKELADPQTGRINWTDMDTLKKLDGLLLDESMKRSEKVRETASIFPRWMPFRNPDSVVKQQSAVSDLRIVESAKTELTAHIETVKVMKQTEAKIYTALGLNPNGKFTDEQFLAALDHNKNGKLDAQDKAEIRKKLGDDKLADGLFESLKSRGITFEDQQLSELTAASAAGGSVVSPGAANPPGNKTEFWSGGISEIFSKVVSWVGDQLSGVVDWVKNLSIFGGSSNPPVASVPMTSMSGSATGLTASFPVVPPTGLPGGGPGMGMTP